MTPEQRAALDALPPKRRAFVLAYVGECQGNGTAAARLAGYQKPDVEAARLLVMAKVAAAVEAIRRPSEEAAIASIEEQRQFWTSVQRADEQAMRDRLKASELLGKSHGAFVDRVEQTGTSSVTMQVAVIVQGSDDAEAYERFLRAERSKRDGE